MTFDSGDYNAADDGFETATTIANVAIATSYALNSTVYGARVTVTVTTANNIRKLFPATTDITDQWVDVWLDPNSIAFSGTDAIVFAGDMLSDGTNRTWALRLGIENSPYNLRARMRNDAGTYVDIDNAITDGPHHVRLHFVRASSNVAADGSGTLWIDDMDTPAGTWASIDNYDIYASIDRLDFGNIFSPSLVGGGGTYYLDEYRASYNSTLGTDIAADYEPQTGSPALNIGVASAYTTDYNGVARADPPDVGAFEYVA
jgi:hypothetical protein